MRDYEASFLMNYKSYLEYLERMCKGMTKIWLPYKGFLPNELKSYLEYLEWMCKGMAKIWLPYKGFLPDELQILLGILGTDV